jgi:predicted nucleic acid-binding protein
MDKIVVDSSVAIKWFVVEPFSTEAHRILDEYQTGTLTLLAPDLLYAEVGNVVWKKHRFLGLCHRRFCCCVGCARTSQGLPR